MESNSKRQILRLHIVTIRSGVDMTESRREREEFNRFHTNSHHITATHGETISK